MSNFEDKKMDGHDSLDPFFVQQLDAIIDSSFDGLWVCDGEGKVVRVNKASEKINSISAKQVISKKMDDLIREGLIDRSATLEVLKTGTAVTVMQHLKNGKQILVTGNPVFNEKGEISLVVVNERDITELNRLRSELEKTRALSQEYRNEILQYYNKEGLFSDLIIKTGQMRRVFKTAMKVAQVDSIVLIQGESGAGKGLFARLIHQASHRNDGPFIRVDCGSIPDSLIESELFGYKGGAFTGALPKGKPGQFDMADGGTLFLDEIGELPLMTQVKLLRFIEENKIIPIGGTNPKTINARIIAATHRDLEVMIDKSQFRRDLFFRLNVVPLKIPPLRRRVEAIPSLIHLFLKKCNLRYNSSKVILPKAVDKICMYSFPGNIRELANLIEQLVVLSPKDEIDLEDLPGHILNVDSDAEFKVQKGRWNLRSALEKLEKDMISRALKDFGTQRKAAVPLGINQSTLARKAKRYGIGGDAALHHDV